MLHVSEKCLKIVTLTFWFSYLSLYPLFGINCYCKLKNSSKQNQKKSSGVLKCTFYASYASKCYGQGEGETSLGK